ncbi:AMP-binding protein [Pseudoduganella sp. SL102]|uniref:AMP-binding protein n=1 Tax=Pseudoduganella sp. SL102 TaxID=2995154 RepID=UPI00248D3520|nr:AMP-binding protein [Pseudoduganella sp. SL102]WBS00682.1 AMP-binding protein [Pseudoduganella sp. SL102]
MLDLGRTFLQSVERSPHALAVVDGEQRLSYGAWYDRIQRVAAGLSALGLVRGDHLVAVLQNRLEMATLHWACQFAGIVITPLNWRATAEEVDHCATDSGARAIVYEAISAAAVAGSVAARRLTRIAVGLSEGVMPFEVLLATAPRSPILQARSDDFSLMLYTSGTTGRPKGVPRRHRAERAAALGHVAQNLYRRGERTLGVMPLYHTMGVRSLLAMALVDGTFVCMPRFDPGLAFQHIRKERISSLYLVPTLYHDMLAWRERHGADVSSVRKLGYAGAPMPEGLLKRLVEVFQPELFVNHYGSSEVFTFAYTQEAQRKTGSAGRAGLNTRIRIVPLGADSPDLQAGPDEEGQIICELEGEEAFEGYRNRPEANDRAIRHGWYFTGDTGYFDGDGDLFVTGRVDDMIISGGENISPADIESVLSLHPAVDEVAVAGLHDERWGQRVVAFVKARGDTSASALDEHCRNSSLLQFKRPRDYVFVREIPKSPVGKILRRKLVAGEYEALVPSAITGSPH